MHPRPLLANTLSTITSRYLSQWSTTSSPRRILLKPGPCTCTRGSPLYRSTVAVPPKIKLRRVRATPGLHDLPSVALTAYAGHEDQERALAAGFQAHIAKPIDIDQTVEVLARLVSEHPADG